MKNRSTAILLLAACMFLLGVTTIQHNIIMKQRDVIRQLYDDAWGHKQKSDRPAVV